MNAMIVRCMLATLLVGTLFADAVRGQEEPKVVIAVIGLEHANPQMVARIIHELGTDVYTVVPNPEPPQILVQGPEEAVRQTRELVRQIDVAVVQEEKRIETAFIPVSSYPLEEMFQVLAQSLQQSEELRLAIDTVNQRVVVTGTPDEIQMTRRFVEELDRPDRALALNFFFISGKTRGGTQIDPGKIPEPLIPIAETLVANGFGDLSLMAPVIVRVSDGKEFDSEAMLRLPTPDGKVELLSFDVKGHVRSDAETGRVKVRVAAGMYGHPDPQRKRETSAQFELETTLVTELGRYVVLAAAPSSTADGDLVALVVRVTEGQ
jgi:hypothetical protein